MTWIENNERLSSVCDVQVCIYCKCGKIFPAFMTEEENDYEVCPDCRRKYKVTASIFEETGEN
jgi:hypothetical protein